MTSNKRACPPFPSDAVIRGRVSWIILGITASIFLLRELFGCHGSFPFSELGLESLKYGTGFHIVRIEMVVGITLGLLAVLGFVLRWGPIVPSTILGIIAVKLFLFIFVGPSSVAYEAHVAYPLAIESDISILLFGIICGASVGIAIDRWQSRAPQHTVKDDK